jgi:hypothetical protein
MMEPLKLDWSTAEVSDGKLTVGLSAKPPKDWRDAFGRTAVLLSAGSWEVALNAKKASVQIASIRPGDEERVRQFIEGVVLEANTTLVSEEAELFEGQLADDDEQQPDPEASEPSPDEQLTGRFRGFAEARSSGDD